MADNDNSKRLEDKLDSVRQSLDENRKAIRDAQSVDKELGRQMLTASGENLKELKEQKKATKEAIATLNQEQSNIIKSLEGTQKYNLGVVAEKIAVSNQLLKDEMSANQLQEKLVVLNDEESTEETRALKALFEQAVMTLKDPEASAESIELAREQLTAIQESAQTEEERREAAKQAKAERNIFNRMAVKLDNVAEGIANMESKAAGGLGMIAALGGIALALFDPQTLFDILARAMKFVSEVIKTVEDIFSGEQSVFGGIASLFENFGTEMAVVGGFLALKFGLISKTFKAVSSTFRAVPKIVAGISKAFSSIPKIFSSVSGAAKGLFGVVGKLALPITIITGIIGGIINSFDKFKEGDILGGFYAFVEGAFDTIVSAPLNLIKDLTAWVLSKFGFDESADYLNSFDFSFQGIVDFISDSIGAIFDWVIGLIPGAGDAVKMVKKGVGGVIDFFTGGGDDKEEEPQVTAFTTDNELREMAKAKAADSWFTSEDEAFNDLVAQRFEAEDAYVNQDQKEETKPYSEMNDYEKKMARQDRRKRAQKEARRRYKGEAGGLEEDRINTSTPIERAVDPKLQQSRERLRKAEADYKFAQSTGDDDAIRIFGTKLEARKMEVADMERTTQPSPVRDAVVENQMLREEEQAAATNAVVDNSSRQNSNSSVSSNTTNVYNTAFVDDVNSGLAFSL